MSYIIRNTIVLGVVLFVIAGLGIYLTMFTIPNKIKKTDQSIKMIEIKLQNTPDLANEFNSKTTELEDIKKRWETRNKDLPVKDITGETYNYLSNTIDMSGEVRMDVSYVESKDFGRYGYNVYRLKGDATFYNLYKFISYIENGKRLYKISGLGLQGYMSKSSETGELKKLVTFEMELQAYYSTIQELNQAPTSSIYLPVKLNVNPFDPLLTDIIPPRRPDEIEIERSILTAVTADKAVIIDQDNKTRILSEGDPVYLGAVTKIYPDEGKIECMLNKGGVSERFELSIRKGQPVK